MNIRELNPVGALWYNLLGGAFRVKLTDDRGPGRRYGNVLDKDGEIIGSASDYCYGASGFSINTKAFAGFVPVNQIEFIEN